MEALQNLVGEAPTAGLSSKLPVMLWVKHWVNETIPSIMAQSCLWDTQMAEKSETQILIAVFKIVFQKRASFLNWGVYLDGGFKGKCMPPPPQ